MDRIAIISDIHGNLEALNTVLEDIKKRNINKIYCLGDIIAKGSHPQECVDLIRKNCEVILKGNCEEFYTGHKEVSDDMSPLLAKRWYWNRSLLNEETLDYLNRLPLCHEFYMSGRLIRLIHAHPQGTDIFAGNIDTIERLYNLFLPSKNTISQEKADILIYGHIHTPFIQKLYNRLIINVGSVGNAIDVFRNDEKDADERNTTLANYLILSGNLNSKNINEPISYELVCLPYDIDKELSNSKDNIEFESYKTELKRGRYRDMQKIYNSFETRGIDKDKI